MIYIIVFQNHLIFYALLFKNESCQLILKDSIFNNIYIDTHYNRDRCPIINFAIIKLNCHWNVILFNSYTSL
jgi:hypothetical protein